MIKIDEYNDELLCPECGRNYHHIDRVGTELDPAGDENKKL